MVRAVVRWLDRERDRGPYHPRTVRERDSLFARVRDQLAEAIGASPAEIALAENATEGVNLAASALRWRRGDEVILSDREHPSGYLPWFIARDRWGVRVKVVPTGDGAADFLARVGEALTPRTRAVCVSHVAWLNGERLPVEALAPLCRRRGAILCVDGAQTLGHIPFEVHRQGCDLYALSGQKWLMAPQGTGALWVRRGLWEELDLPLAGWRSGESRLATLTFDPWPDARRFELATASAALVAGLSEALALHARLGGEAIELRVRSLASRLVACLRDIPGVELLTPLGRGPLPAPTGLVSFRIPGMEAEDAVETLFRRARAVVRSVPAEPAAVRVSCHYLNREEEVEALAEHIAALARRGARASSQGRGSRSRARG